MGKFSYVKYKNAYAIGNIDLDGNITGYGYWYFFDTNAYTMGRFVEDKPNGWMCSTIEDEDFETVYIRKYKNDEQVPGLTISSDSECLSFAENVAGGDCIGYCLRIWSDGCWRYQYDDGKEEFRTKAVQFYPEYDGLYMTYRVEEKNEWEKQIGKGQISDFAIPFHRFQQKVYKKVDFSTDDHSVWSKTGGPMIHYDSEEDSTWISCWKDNKHNGILYYDCKDKLYLSQLVNSKRQGGDITIFKDSGNFKYTYFNKGKQGKIEVIWFRDSCALEVRKYCYGDFEHCDLIQIDKDFNVWFAKKWVFKTKKSAKELNFDWDQEYIGAKVDDKKKNQNQK